MEIYIHKDVSDYSKRKKLPNANQVNLVLETFHFLQ